MRFVTTQLVLMELCNAFSSPSLRDTAVRQVASIEHSARWQLVEMSGILWREGFALYSKMNDKSWGLVDCTSIVVARKLGITTVFTADRHFTQAGFAILLQEG
jgi:uncharacterized protein